MAQANKSSQHQSQSRPPPRQHRQQPRPPPPRPDPLNTVNLNAKVLYSGILMKKGEYNKTWRKRWFVLYDNRQLSYYHSRDDFQDSKRAINHIDLKQVTSINPVNKSMNKSPQQKKKQKKGFFRSSKSSSPVSQPSISTPSYMSHNGSLRSYINDNEPSQSMSVHDDSPIPTLGPSSSSSLRMSFKSLMGKKSPRMKQSQSFESNNT
eukprot:407348_1